MKNKITVAIAGQEYTMVAEEDENYVHRCATLVDSQVREQEASENLRRQIKDGLDENARLKMELSEAKREIFKLQNAHKS